MRFDVVGSNRARIAFKMARGAGKTVVMACLILYHFLNRRQYRSDMHRCADALDYYRQRALCGW